MSNDTDRDRLSGIQQRPGGSAAAGAEAPPPGRKPPWEDQGVRPSTWNYHPLLNQTRWPAPQQTITSIIIIILCGLDAVALLP
jgi:hypothetical protein